MGLGGERRILFEGGLKGKCLSGLVSGNLGLGAGNFLSLMRTLSEVPVNIWMSYPLMATLLRIDR